MPLALSGLYIYPIKSARGTRLERAHFSDLGLDYDRRWMLVNPEGHFLSQREIPDLARLEVQLQTAENALILGFDGEGLELPLPQDETYLRSELLEVQLWRSRVAAQAFAPVADRWLSEKLNRACRLVYMPRSTFRETNPEYAPGRRVSFADGYPFLLTHEASLEDLNQRLEQALPMDRFRPNLVVRGGEAFAEDRWRSFELGGHHFVVAKPCERCVMTTQDQQTGERSPEPLRTLARYRKLNGKIIFGQNLYSESQAGFLELGQELKKLAF